MRPGTRIRGASVFDIAPTFAIPGVAKEGDRVSIRPRYRWNNATGRNADPAFVQGDIFPERYHEIGGDASYLAPVLGGRIYLGPTLQGNVRYYRSNVPGGSTRRRDVYLRPGVQLIVPNAFVNGHTLTFQYQHERNISNADGKGFRNHVVGTVRPAFETGLNDLRTIRSGTVLSTMHGDLFAAAAMIAARDAVPFDLSEERAEIRIFEQLTRPPVA